VKKLKNTVIAALLAIVPFAAAHGADANLYEPPNGGCGMGGVSESSKVPVSLPGLGSPDINILRLAQDIMAFDKAHEEFFRVNVEILRLLRNHCSGISFGEAQQSHEKAFEDRKENDARYLNKDIVRWVEPKKAPKPPSYYQRWSSSLEKICRIAEEPPRLEIPIITGNLPEEDKKLFSKLAESIKTFYGLQLKQYSLAQEMLRLEEGFRCRETVQSYYSLRDDQYENFWYRRSDHLAPIAAHTVRWEAIP